MMDTNTNTRSFPTSSLGSKNNINMPPLAYHTSRQKYTPKYGDFIIWSKWFTTWYGVVSDYDLDKNEVSVIFEGLPVLLFMINNDEQYKLTYKIKLMDIRNAKSGKYAILQQDESTKEGVWFV